MKNLNGIIKITILIIIKSCNAEAKPAKQVNYMLKLRSNFTSLIERLTSTKESLIWPYISPTYNCSFIVVEKESFLVLKKRKL